MTSPHFANDLAHKNTEIFEITTLIIYNEYFIIINSYLWISVMSGKTKI
jgi:hypothetical protein